MKNVRKQIVTRNAKESWETTKKAYEYNDNIVLLMDDLEFVHLLGCEPRICFIDDFGVAETEFLNQLYIEASGEELSNEIQKILDVVDLVWRKLKEDSLN